MVDRNFQKMENGLDRQGGLSRGNRSKQVSLYLLPIFLSIVVVEEMVDTSIISRLQGVE